MMLKVLASSSAGNCYLLKSESGTLIIECGIRFSDIMLGLNFDLSNVKALLLTHEHNDHSKSVKQIMGYGIDAHMSELTAEALNLSGHRLKIVESLKQLEVDGFRVLPFDVQHDAVAPLGFLIEEISTGFKLCFATDTYYVKYNFPGLNAICIECNYIEETLDRNIELGLIPEEMKPRLLRSHFSLENVLNFLRATDLSECTNIVLLHLSANNADSKIMIEQIEKLTGITPVIADSGVEVEMNLFPY